MEHHPDHTAPPPHAPRPAQSDWARCRDTAGDEGGHLLHPVGEVPASWAGLPMTVMLLPANCVALGLTVNHPCLALARSGRGRRRYTMGLRVRELYSAPTMFELYEEGLCIDRACWDGVAGEVLGVQFPSTVVSRLLHTQDKAFRLPTRMEQFDPRVSTLATLMWDESQRGAGLGPLYAEGLALALIGLLVNEHGALGQEAEDRATRLPTSAVARIRDYIEQHLATEMSIAGLAALVQMSPARFARAFKASLGVSPHAYVTERRMEAARDMLRANERRSLAEIAIGLGYSSQAHFTETFRRKTGFTPGRWRDAQHAVLPLGHPVRG